MTILAIGQIDKAINWVPTKWDENDRRRFRASCFGHLLTMHRPMNFSGAIIHQLLLREVHHNWPSNEMQFMIGTHEVRFSKVEFRLITGLQFDKLPDTSRYVSVDNGIHHRYLGGKDEISSLELRDVLRCLQGRILWPQKLRGVNPIMRAKRRRYQIH
ncbi:hypothetical protein Ddye_025497 [Dipteronia dyeriana]|uniref:Uncharacterized protein n=1 Tax=Dipteronia dyeriana TaxID=168575 RepID=A0AAD9TKC2_9ROSI|nr:hypothetical protein Ddye_025497 [Dipteronia dyeriana]